jgi:hypothetical protein
MESVRKLQKKYGSRAITLAIIAWLFFFMAGHQPMGKGLILGTIFSVINFVLIGETLPQKIGKSKRKTFFLSLSSIGLRYAILAIPLIVAVKFEQFDIITTIVGIFMIQIMILADRVLKTIARTRETH